jgi:hypothetical protein
MPGGLTVGKVCKYSGWGEDPFILPSKRGSDFYKPQINGRFYWVWNPDFRTQSIGSDHGNKS